MISAYFPFTYVSEATANKISDIFGRFLIYQPVKKLTSCFFSDELVDLRIPTLDREKEIREVLNDHLAWTYTNCKNGKTDINLLRTISEISPFCGSDSVTTILQGVKNVNNSKSEESDENILFDACLFLALAQYNDLYNDQFNSKIGDFKAREKLLIQVLQGHVPDGFIEDMPDSFSSEDNLTVSMCSARIRAWAAMVLEDDILPDFIVTDNFTVVESLLDINIGVETLKLRASTLCSGNNRKGDAKLLDYVRNLVFQRNFIGNKVSFSQDTVASHEADFDGGITLYVMPDLSLESFLRKIAPDRLRSTALVRENIKVRNTVIADIS